jgi:excinuclease UvrABC nuclease subunit
MDRRASAARPYRFRKDMISAAEKLDFERAAELRDMIKQLLEGPQKGRSKKRR